jgi:hypothetical protein
MPIFKISSALKKADRDINDPTALCIDCEYPTEKGNPLKFLGVTPDDSRKLFGHMNCSSFRDKLNEEKELKAREQDGVFAFASKFRYIANNNIENSTVESTFPMLDRSQEVDNMTTKQVDANYVDGAPVPPKH